MVMSAMSTVDFRAGAPVRGDLDVQWIHGSRGRDGDRDPAFQVHAYDAHTYVLRQSKDASAEAPFIYLLLGNNRALLLDTGAGQQPGGPLRTVVDGIIAGWLAEHPRGSYELVVAHTHGHGDHVAGDSQFADRPGTTVVSRELAAVQEFFGFTDWPAQTVPFDLGGRRLEITGSPGHHRAAITVYDPWSGFLVTHVMGCHIEMTGRPGRDYPLGCRYQPGEPPLQMTVAQLEAVRDAARTVAGRPGQHRFDDFVIMNGPYRGYVVRLLARGLWARLWPGRNR
jgi:hydroxyacylglutathione hydrolase